MPSNPPLPSHFATTRARASDETLRARRWERLAQQLHVETEKAEEKLDWPSDFAMSARLTWMEAGRHLDQLCARDGIDRWTYRWPTR